MIDKDTLLRSTRTKQDHIPHVSHSGALDPRHYARPGTPAALVTHPNHPVNQAVGQIEQQHVRADLGVAPKVKRFLTEAPPINSGMATRFRKDVGTALGADHSSAINSLSGQRVPADSSGRGATVAHPLTKLAPGKPWLGTTVKPVVGQRSRVDEVDVEGVGAAQARAESSKAALHAARRDLGAAVIQDAIDEHPGKPTAWQRNKDCR